MADWPYSTARWQRLRKAKLSESPLCETCERRGRKVEAQHVDHIVAIAAGGPAFPVMDGLRALCASCHSIKTNALDRAGGKGVAIKGCDVNGLPLDPDHPFMQCGVEGKSDAQRSVVGGPEGDLNDHSEHAVLVGREEGLGSGLDSESDFICVQDCPVHRGATSAGLHCFVAGRRRGQLLRRSDCALLLAYPLEGRGAVAPGPAAHTASQLVRDWGV
jgi:5-methylcytosine-specific restriction protein A